MVAGGLVASVLLSSCTDGEEGRRFANDPRTKDAPTATMVVTPPPSPVVDTPAPARPFSEVVAPRGAPSRVYLRAGSDLLGLSAESGTWAPVFKPGPGRRIVDYDASPSGDRVAVLVEEDGQAAVDVLGPDGQPLARFGNVGSALGLAEAGPRSLDWSPQGDLLLAAFSPGGLVALPVSGDGPPAVVAGPDAAPWPAVARWSPTGESVALVSGSSDQRFGELLVIPAAGRVAATPVAGQGTPAATPGATPVAASPALTDPRRGQVENIAWLPDGRSLLFTERPIGPGTGANADLWRIGADGGDRTLVVSAGSAAPVASVALVSPSPDGSSVAYTVTVPGVGGPPRFHSLWVRELASERTYRIVTSPEVAVTDIWWSSRGLMFRVVPQPERGPAYDGGAFDIYLVDADGQASRLLTASVAATPVASPQG